MQHDCKVGSTDTSLLVSTIGDDIRTSLRAWIIYSTSTHGLWEGLPTVFSLDLRGVVRFQCQRTSLSCPTGLVIGYYPVPLKFPNGWLLTSIKVSAFKGTGEMTLNPQNTHQQMNCEHQFVKVFDKTLYVAYLRGIVYTNV